MKYIKSIKLFLLSFSLLVMISACGDGSGSSEPEVTPVLSSNISVIECSNASDGAYTPIEEGDELVPDDSNTTVEIVHDEDEGRLVCVLNGSAHLVR